jgi:hypothetical protein
MENQSERKKSQNEVRYRSGKQKYLYKLYVPIYVYLEIQSGLFLWGIPIKLLINLWFPVYMDVKKFII